MEQLFVYGTLQDPAVQQRVFGRTTPGKPDVLHGYTKSEIHLGVNVYPIAVPDENGEIAGRVLDVTPEELVLMDRYEGAEYERARVTVASGAEVWVYRQPANA